jgi:hypothetical protein
MDIYLDHEPFETDQTTLAGVLDAAQQHLAGGDRLVVEVRLDGDPLSEEDIIDRRDEAIDVEELQLITADPIDLAMQTLVEVREALVASREDHEQAARLLQQDQAGEGMEHVKRALNTWQQAQAAVVKTAQLARLELDGLTVNERPAGKVVDELRERLEAVRNALVSNDWVGLADAFEYELTESIDTWSEMLDELGGELERRRAD